MTFTLSDQLKGEIDLGKIDNHKINGIVTKVEGSDSGFVTFKISGLDIYADGERQGVGESRKWKYSISEAQVPGFDEPVYLEKDAEEPLDNASGIGDGGTIVNKETPISLPSTGGPGTGRYTLIGCMLLVLAGILQIVSRKWLLLG